MNRLCLLGGLQLFLGVALAFAASGCSPHIGDKCVLNTDCSLQGTLVCDTSEPNGYCTFFNCSPDTCQDKAACVMLHPSVPGCPYDDYKSPPRTGRTMCLARCTQDSDCRTSDGYVCRDPRQAPWNALIVDDDQSQTVCVVSPDYPYSADQSPNASFVDAGVCSSNTPVVPPIDAGVTAPEAGNADAAGEASADAGVDAPADGAGGDGSGDASSDGAADAGAADAPGGG